MTEVKRSKIKPGKRHLYPRKNKCLICYRSRNDNTEEVKEAFVNGRSADGLDFDTFEPIDPGADLECEIYQLAGSQKTVIIPAFITAKVEWIKKIDNAADHGGNKYRIGVRFVEARDEEKTAGYDIKESAAREGARVVNIS